MLAVYARKTHFKKSGRYGPYRLAFYQDMLAQALGTRTFTPRYTEPRPRLRLVNWGCSEKPNLPINVEWVGNTPEAVAVLGHKRKMFDAFRKAGVPALESTTDVDVANKWLEDGGTVYVRHTLQGHSGKGIERVTPGNGILPKAPLYTKGITGKFREYRVHVFNGQVICVQQKKRMSAATMQAKGFNVDEETRSAVRTYRNGWVFSVENITPLDDAAKKIAVDAITACGATAGATDLLTTCKLGAVVIETNSAPALRSPTVKQAYVDAITRAA